MKPFLAILLLAASYLSANLALCNSDLLFSYGIKNPRYLPQNGLYCQTSSAETCCDNGDQSRALRKWNRFDRQRVKPFLESRLWLVKAILNYYEDLIVVAKFMNSDENASPFCKDASSKLVLAYKRKKELETYVKKLEETLVAIGFARKSFYCSLCSLENQKYFVKDSKTVIFSEEFCSNLVTLSISSSYYSIVQILSDFQSMSDILDCREGQEGHDRPYTLTLGESAVTKVTQCFEGFLKYKDPAMFTSSCIEYCKEFSLSQASDLFEGNVSALSDLFERLRDSDLVVTDPIFNDIKMNAKYDFFKLRRQFFRFELGFEDLGKYQSVFEPYGMNLFKEAKRSMFFYGPANSLNVLNEFEEEKGINILGVFLMVGVLLF